MKKFCFILCLLTASVTWAQKPDAQKTTAKDWELLDKTFAAFIKAIEKNDKAAFMATSLKVVDCAQCIRMHEFNEGNNVQAEIFFEIMGENFPNSPVYKALLKRGYTFSTIMLKKPAVKAVTKEAAKEVKLYEVWVPTYLKNELSKGHQGASHGFQFIKVNGQFKFYGLVSIP